MEKLLRNIVYKTNGSGEKVIDDSSSLDLTSLIKSYQVEHSDLDGASERTASGKIVRDYIRTVRTVKCVFRPLNQTEASKVLALLGEKELTLAFYDALTGVYSEEEAALLHAYPSASRNASLYGINPQMLYNEISVDFIEF